MDVECNSGIDILSSNQATRLKWAGLDIEMTHLKYVS